MAELLVVGFKKDMYRASEALNQIKALNKTWDLDLSDAVAVYRDYDGTLREIVAICGGAYLGGRRAVGIVHSHGDRGLLQDLRHHQSDEEFDSMAANVLAHQRQAYLDAGAHYVLIGEGFWGKRPHPHYLAFLGASRRST